METVNQHTIDPEVTPSFLLTSIYLWPFFAVWSLNRPSWSGYNRDAFNRFNAVGALSLLDSIALLALVPDLAQKLSGTGAMGVFIALFVAHWFWLNGKRGERLKQRFAVAPARTKSTVRAISAAVFGGLLIWCFVTLPSSNPRHARSMDCGNATEVTATACDTESGR